MAAASRQQVPVALLSARLSAGGERLDHRVIRLWSRGLVGIFGMRVRRVGDLIRREYARRFAVGELAKAACLSRSRFMELFREQFGNSPGEFHRHVQTEKAVELARYTGMSWQQIALHLGYADASHFSRVFKRVMGLPPSEYLARMRDPL